MFGSLYFTIVTFKVNSGTVQIGTGKVDQDRKFKCTTAARGILQRINIFTL